MGHRNEIADLWRAASGQGLKFGKEAAQKRANATATAIDQLKLIKAETDNLTVTGAFGPLQSGKDLERLFNSKCDELRRMIGRNIESLEAMVDSLLAAGRIHAEAEAGSTKGFRDLLKKGPVAYDRYDVDLRGGQTFTIPRFGNQPSNKSYRMEGSPPVATERDTRPRTNNFYQAPIGSAGGRKGVPPPLIEAGIDPSQIDRLAREINVAPGTESAARWSMLSRAVGKTFEIMSSEDWNDDDWQGRGADQARAAAAAFRKQSHTLTTAMHDVSDNLKYAVKVMWQTRDFMQGCLPATAEVALYPGEDYPERSKRAHEQVNEANRLFAAVYVPGVKGAAAQMPILDGAVPTKSGAPEPSPGGPGGPAGGGPGGPAGGGPGGPAGGGPGGPAGTGPAGSGLGPGPGLDNRHGAPSRPDTGQLTPQASTPGAAQAAQAAQQAMQAGQRALEEATKAGPPPTSTQVPGGLAPTGAGARTGQSSSGARGGGPAANATKPEARAQNPQSRMFPRASVTGAPAAPTPRAGLASSGPGAGTPGGGGSPGQGAGQGQNKGHERLKDLTNRANADDAIGAPRHVAIPVIEQ
ncbi:hypothetical protein [Nocardia sp. BMG51109]|uniref:hypothetical protein n=1 Tax=Nocardia sp. BMG51109 TaxID=1056816 RepID=UPI0012EC45A2|nr:hypothetical protein [Nocardia sp. BMG51109]